jgi:transcriptional regulator with XRE-family HTH domain
LSIGALNKHNLQIGRAILAAHLRELRISAGLTQETIAEHLNVPQSVVSRAEAGERRLDIVELYHLCSACGVSLTDFVKRFEKAVSKQSNAR